MTDIKLELEQPQKVVDYFGLELVVPDEKLFIATQPDGEVYMFLGRKPSAFEECKAWVDTYYSSQCFEIGKIKTMPHPNWWRESLVEV